MNLKFSPDAKVGLSLLTVAFFLALFGAPDFVVSCFMTAALVFYGLDLRSLFKGE